MLIPGALEGIASLSDSTLCERSATDSLSDWNVASSEGITLAVQSPETTIQLLKSLAVLILYMSKVVWHLSFSVWFILFRLKVHLVINGRIFPLFQDWIIFIYAIGL